MLLGLLKVRTVNLMELASAFDSGAQCESRYRRIRRFFSQHLIKMSEVAAWVVSLFAPTGKIWLSIDRTNWCWGKSEINILMLSIVYKGIAVPVAWSLLQSTGNSKTAERIELLQKLVAQVGKARIAGILGDREFVGNDWFEWLRKEGISFCIRIKKNTLVTNSRGAKVHVASLFQRLKSGEQDILPTPRKIWKQAVYLSALRLSDGALLIVATDTLCTAPIAQYGKRWEVETLFGCLKSKGFNFEDTHMVQPDRIHKLIALLSMAFCWAHKVGEWRHEEKPIKIKKHGRKSQSLFRYGLDYLRDLLINPRCPYQHQFENLTLLLVPVITPQNIADMQT
jgi:hypothetical protein